MEREQNRRPTRRILLAEDDLSLEIIFTSLIHDIDLKIDVDWVTSAEAAFERLEKASAHQRESPYDLIVADIFLDGDLRNGVLAWPRCRPR